jgi:D-serine deaminase-like pyridoxal phosphate-dependent protein
VTDTMIDRLIALEAKTDGLMIVIDNPGNVHALAGAAQQAGRTLGVLVDFDVGQGARGSLRSTVRSPLRVRRRLLRISPTAACRPTTAICST